jgi:hypothetical protein
MFYMISSITAFSLRVIKTFILFLCLLPGRGIAQKVLTINLGQIDGISITPGNIFNYQIQSSFPTCNALIRGQVHYRNSNLSFSYSFTTVLRPGVNMIASSAIHPQWQFSASALQELFLTYKILPEGTYEYCVTVMPNYRTSAGEPVPETIFDECLYHRSEDMFLINLIEPENNAKIHEYNPMLSWVANYSFASALSYRIRVADIKQGQNAQNAISRNNPVYDQSNLMQNTVIYPVFAKPLIKDQPYAWTIDAFYKGILLGGSETWKFTIIDDTIYNGVLGNTSYIDITREKGNTTLYAIGDIKLKYDLTESRKDSLMIKMYDANNASVTLKEKAFAAVYGDNRYQIIFKDVYNLKHMAKYSLVITNLEHQKYIVPFRYINPDLTH